MSTPAQPSEQLRLIRGSTVLGTIIRDHSTDDFPWFGGVFSPTEHFAEVQPLFDAELRLLNDSTEDSQ